MDIRFQNCINKFNDIILTELYEKEIKCWIAGGSVRDYLWVFQLKQTLFVFPDLVIIIKQQNILKIMMRN